MLFRSDPRVIHRLITLDHLLRMRSGLGFPVVHSDGQVTLGFENSAIYQDAGDAFDAAQRSIVATMPGAVYRYINSGLNVLGAIIRDQIEKRGLPYHETLYGLLIDRLGMASYQYSADITGNLIASGAGFATLRDYAKLGMLYLQNGIWDGEQLLPQGWADYALTATHTGTSYAACFRTNIDRLFPDLPPDTALGFGRFRPAHLHLASPPVDRSGQQRDRPSDGPACLEPRHCDGNRGLGIATG